jgi:hypothetical protein
VFTAVHGELQPLYATFASLPEPVGPTEGGTMRRPAVAVAALLAAVTVAASLGATTSKPYIGSWQARVTKAQLLDQGIADPRMPGRWKLILSRNGTYKAYNPLDKWFAGEYSAGPTRLVVRKDATCGQFPGPGIYRWSVKDGRLKLTQTSFGSDPCGGRTQQLTIPLWTRG